MPPAKNCCISQANFLVYFFESSSRNKNFSLCIREVFLTYENLRVNYLKSFLVLLREELKDRYSFRKSLLCSTDNFLTVVFMAAFFSSFKTHWTGQEIAISSHAQKKRGKNKLSQKEITRMSPPRRRVTHHRHRWPKSSKLTMKTLPNHRRNQ